MSERSERWLGWYTLAPGTNRPVAGQDVLTWGRWMETADRRVRLTQAVAGDATAHVSTAFLGLDHDYSWLLGGDRRAPLLWETMIFVPDGSPGEDWGVGVYQRRFRSYRAAVAGHKRAVRAARSILLNNRRRRDDHAPAAEGTSC